MCKFIKKVGSFVDYEGKERRFVIVAASIEEECSIVTEVPAKEQAREDESYSLKTLSIGVSVCRPNDTFDEEMGTKIALGKAIKYRNHALFATDCGCINTTVVNALLEQECEYIKKNPGRYMAGYDKDKAKYEEAKALAEYRASLPATVVEAIPYIARELEVGEDKILDLINAEL